MRENRQRLSTAIFRRAKIDTRQADGSPLFARRWVHTESFLMNQEERLFYEKLREYLEDCFDLARRRGSKGRALKRLLLISRESCSGGIRPPGKGFVPVEGLITAEY